MARKSRFRRITCKRQPIRPLVLLKKPASWGLGQRISKDTCFVTGGGRQQGVRLISGSTVGSDGLPATNLWTVTFSEPVSTSDNIAGITLLVNGSPATFSYSFDDGTSYTYLRTDASWSDGEDLEFLLDNSGGQWIDGKGDPINDQSIRITNLYNAPVLRSARIPDGTNQVVAAFDVACSDDGGPLPGYTGDAQLYSCDRDLYFTLGVAANQAGDGTITYDIQEPVNVGEKCIFTAAGMTARCDLYDLTVGWNQGFLYGYRTPNDPNGGFGRLRRADGTPHNSYQLSGNISGTNNNVVLKLGDAGDEPTLGGDNAVDLTFGGHGDVTLLWDDNTKDYRVVDANTTAWLQSQNGKTVRVGATGLLDPDPNNLIPIGNDRTFDTGIDNWYTVADRGLVEWRSDLQAISLTQDATSAPNGFSRILLEMNLPADGRSYRFEADLVETNFGSLTMAISNQSNGDAQYDAGPAFSDLGRHTLIVTPTASPFYLKFGIQISTADGRYFVLDNMALYEV